ncbi:MAG: valine--tRNA ligase, partial [Chloroflexota bacterium]
MTPTANIEEMPKAYEPQKVEQKWYRFWLQMGYFTPKIDHKKKPFVIIMPPPNVTGELHVGHALTAVLEDIMIRWHRMRGEPTLWLPGIDHAGIATQVVVEKQLAKEGTSRYKIGREEFEARVRKWAESCRHTIGQQHQRLGVSCDWSRERFTLDEGPSKAVRTVFVNLYKKGLIYRGERIINWCPRCATALSDLEVDHNDLDGHLWYVRYPLAENKGEYITVATTRPETILGDTAVAVNPGDERYQKLVGKVLRLPFVNREIPIIADEAVSTAFGTGAVKITPAHDPVDFEVARRHNLPLINILNPDATMNENAGPYRGRDRFACRKAIVADLEKAGLLVRIEPYRHAVGHCQRCIAIIEPIASKQWFVRMAPLAQPAIEAVRDGRITIIPERFTKVYLNWMENIRDWCVSRQLWWGHRIPVWYCTDCGQTIAALGTPASCPKCGSTRLEQDPDVLDTWFSSALWPHSTLGWPDDTEDFRYFYPTTVMETGYDILFFWVARMIMMGLEDTGGIPFRTVYLHGLVRDEKGDKMSKVRGNVLNPLATLEEYGTDALRMALTTGTSPGNDIKIAPERLAAARNFANKLWNAARFVVRNIEPEKATADFDRSELPVEDRWILSRLGATVASANRLMAEFQFGEAQRHIYEFVWGDFCDWYIEIAKTRLRTGDLASPQPVLARVLETSLRLLHPFMPFITEELWQNLKNRMPGEFAPAASIMIAPYPETGDGADPQAESVMRSVIEIVRAVRNARAHYQVAADRWVEVRIFAGELKSSLSPHLGVIETLARARPVAFLERRPEGLDASQNLVMVLAETEVVLPMASLLDVEEEKGRLEQEIARCQSEVARLEALLADNAFRSKAPVAVVAKQQQALEASRDRLGR